MKMTGKDTRSGLLSAMFRTIGYICVVHLLTLAAMMVCRIIFLLCNMPEGGTEWGLLFKSLLIGINFDNQVACYVSVLPVLYLPVFTLATVHSSRFGVWMPRAIKATGWWYGILYAIVLFIHIANVRYYQFFGNHLNIQVTEWFAFLSDTAGMIFQDSVNLLYIGIDLVLTALFVWALIAIVKHYMDDWETTHSSASNYMAATGLTLLFIGACGCGMRASFQRYPLSVSFAYFCENPFYNRLGINPIVNIINSIDNDSVLCDEIQEMDAEDAVHFVQNELNICPTDSTAPLLRDAVGYPVVDSSMNVVLVFMESMTADNLERKGNGQWLTPYLRQLRGRSIYFSNCFSAGVHTNNGIVGVHYGFVPNFAEACMKSISTPYMGLPYYLRKAGYSTMCFVTGNPQYDNMNSFWRDNNIEDIYSLYCYDEKAAVNNFGVSDLYMFRWGIEELNRRSKEGKPMFASFLTVSNHNPYVVPEEYKDRGSDESEQIVAYADDAIRQFVEAAKKTDWGKKTVFVLVADHGAILPSPYEMSLPYNRIPCFIFSDAIQPVQIDNVCSQIDIAPTLLSLLGVPYENNTLGVDVLHDSRRYAFFVNNDHLGVSDGKWFYCYNIDTRMENLYIIGSGVDVKGEYPEKMKDMRDYGLNMQCVNLLAIQKGWTYVQSAE